MILLSIDSGKDVLVFMSLAVNHSFAVALLAERKSNSLHAAFLSMEASLQALT